MGRRQQPLARLAVFCSGQGTNLQAILDAIRKGTLHAQVALVISDKKDAPALRRSARAHVEACFVDPNAYPHRVAYERMLIRLLDERQVRLVCLAGFMRILSRVFIRRYPQRILNVHPALLPAFPGAHAIRDALAWGVKVTGVTVHFVDEQLDHGPIIVQEALSIAPRQTPDSLLKKIHSIEHRLYPKAIQWVLDGRVKMSGRYVHVVTDGG